MEFNGMYVPVYCMPCCCSIAVVAVFIVHIVELWSILNILFYLQFVFCRCDECGKKVQTEKRGLLNKLPKTVVMHLKRFEFNFETFMREKVNSRFEFPHELDLEPYTLAVITNSLYVSLSLYLYVS